MMQRRRTCVCVSSLRPLRDGHATKRPIRRSPHSIHSLRSSFTPSRRRFHDKCTAAVDSDRARSPFCRRALPDRIRSDKIVINHRICRIFQASLAAGRRNCESIRRRRSPVGMGGRPQSGAESPDCVVRLRPAGAPLYSAAARRRNIVARRARAMAAPVKRIQWTRRGGRRRKVM
jgi:hypothetical protein